MADKTVKVTLVKSVIGTKQSHRDTVAGLGLNQTSHVIEIAANDGYLLQYIKDKQIPCLGIEPTHSTAEAAKAKGIDIQTIVECTGLSLEQVEAL